MRHTIVRFRRLPLVAVLALAAIGISAGTASAQLDYTGPLHATAESMVFLGEDGTEMVCEGSLEGTITDAGFPAHGDITEMNFGSECEVFGFIHCTVDMNEPLEFHANPATTNTLEVHFDTPVEVERVCPFVGTCHYNAAPSTIEGTYSEATHMLSFFDQPLVGEGDCGAVTWSAEYHVNTPSELHW